MYSDLDGFCKLSCSAGEERSRMQSGTTVSLYDVWNGARWPKAPQTRYRASASMPFAAPNIMRRIAARETDLTVGHHHLNVTDVSAHKAFWVELLGFTESKFGETDVVWARNALIFLREQVPMGGSNGSTVDHLGFAVPNIRGLVSRLQGAGVRIVTSEFVMDCRRDIHYSAEQGVFLAFAEGPDGMRVEFMEDQSLEGVVGHHVHIYTEDDANAQAWYVEHLGGEPGMRGRFKKVDVPGIELSFAPSVGPALPTKGRVLDHIGFEVHRLEEFCAKLKRQGVQFDIPFTKVEGTRVFEAALTDPWGTFISLTEGLNTFSDALKP